MKPVPHFSQSIVNCKWRGHGGQEPVGIGVEGVCEVLDKRADHERDSQLEGGGMEP